MGTYKNEIEEFIYKICYNPMWEVVYQFIYEQPQLLDLSHSQIKYPDSAVLENMIIKFTRNIRIKDDNLLFEAVVSCTISLHEDNYLGSSSCNINQWLVVSCTANVTEKLNSLFVTSIEHYSPRKRKNTDGQAVSKNIVPIIGKNDLDDEAVTFLTEYFPEALKKPTPVPIDKIAKQMGLEILQGYRITDDFSVFGQIYFSDGTAQVYDPFLCSTSMIPVHRGTILVDAYTFWERSLGCVNNTIAHEVYHWYRHRIYATIKHILQGDNIIACRCPSSMIYSKGKSEWSDEQRMEWQANKMASRILMPLQTFRVKVQELYEKYNYKDAELKTAVLINVADELAKFYGVSKQSALIRMTEAGFTEAASVYQYSNSDGIYHAYLVREDAFLVYSNDLNFREIIDSGLFRYLEGYFVVDDPQYIERDESGQCSLTDYAWMHLDECALQFSSITVEKLETHKHPPNAIMYRINTDATKAGYDANETGYDANKNKPVVSEAIKRKRREFELQNSSRKSLCGDNKTCWEAMYKILQERNMSKPHFCHATGLGEEVYRKAKKNIATVPNLRTIIAFARGLDLNIQTTEYLLKLAGHAFNDSDEHQALKFCITGFSGESIEECNKFLASYGYQTLGTKQRY